ncbi:MAG: glycosyltransferase family 4 protein [Candidatus Eisenbacteria bacterium]|nr:glycosyltransferase family 4 protein [Candidatus Eisenbacteria bacterium]
MHLAIVIGRFPPGVIGGAELQAEAWARRLAARHRVTVVTRLDVPGQQPVEERDGFTVRRLPVSPLPGWRTFADLTGIERLLAGLRPRPDVLLGFITFASGLAAVRAGRRLGVPAVVWIRGEAEYRLGASRFHRYLAPRIWRGATGVLVQSDWNRRELLRELGSVSPSAARDVEAKLDVVPNGLELPAGPFPPGDGVLAVGRLIADKGVDVLVDACASAGLALVIAGDGPERGALEARARARGASVRFTGPLSRPQLDPLYRAAAVCVLASRRGEGLPNAVLEAMSYARALVVTPSGATRDLLVDGESGLFVPADDPEALAAALRRLHGEPALAARLGARARQAAEAYAWERVVPRLEQTLGRWLR